MPTLPLTLAATIAAICILWTVKIANRDDDWIRASWHYARAVVAIAVILAMTMLSALCLHLFIHW
jgi:hypothetical protein